MANDLYSLFIDEEINVANESTKEVSQPELHIALYSNRGRESSLAYNCRGGSLPIKAKETTIRLMQTGETKPQIISHIKYVGKRDIWYLILGT